jgi:AcrR family transcriptional regulator
LPKIVDHDARREEILANCFSLFAEQGYAALTMREIAHHLDVSTGTLYHYFDGKLSLFQAMFHWIGERDVRDAALEIPTTLDLQERLTLLKKFLLFRSTHLADTIKIAIDFQRHHSDQEGQLILHNILQNYRNAIRNQLAIDNEHEVQVILSFILGCLIHSTFDSNSVSLDTLLSYLSLIGSLPQLNP